MFFVCFFVVVCRRNFYTWKLVLLLLLLSLLNVFVLLGRKKSVLQK